MKNIQISESALSSIQKHLKESYPYEGCGFMLGIEGETREITTTLMVKNTNKTQRRRRFEISPLDYIKAEALADKTGLTLLGVYHSHPDHPAVPSEHDLRQAVPFFSYLIVSVIKEEIDAITSWQLNYESKFEQEKIMNFINEPLNV